MVWSERAPTIAGVAVHEGSTRTASPSASTLSSRVSPWSASFGVTGRPPAANAAGAVTRRRGTPASSSTTMIPPRSASVPPSILHETTTRSARARPASSDSHSSKPVSEVVQNDVPPTREYATAPSASAPSPTRSLSVTRTSISPSPSPPLGARNRTASAPVRGSVSRSPLLAAAGALAAVNPAAERSNTSPRSRTRDACSGNERRSVSPAGLSVSAPQPGAIANRRNNASSNRLGRVRAKRIEQVSRRGSASIQQSAPAKQVSSARSPRAPAPAR